MARPDASSPIAAMSVDPTDVELAAMRRLRDVADWAGVTGDASDPATVRGAAFAALGAADDTLPRLIGFLPQTDYDTAVTSVRVGDVGLTLIQKASLTLMGRVCRIHAGLQTTAAAAAASHSA